jgi:TPR repeat protein
LEKDNQILKEENKKLKQLAKSQVENIIEPAAKKGDVGAIQVVGECYQHGLGGKRTDEKQAIEYFEQGVSANSPASQCSLGELLVEQKNDVKANERGVELLKRSAAADYPEAQHELALCQWDGDVVQEDEKSAVDLWKKAANSGFAASQYELGECNEQGVGGVEKDMKQAEEWYLKAAEAGELKAQLSLGRIYKNNETLKDLNKSIEWYEKAYYNGKAQYASDALRSIFDPFNKYEVADLEKATEWAHRAGDSFGTGLLVGNRSDRNGLRSLIKGLYRSAIHETNCGLSYNNLACRCALEFQPPLFCRAAMLGNFHGMYNFARDLPDQNPKKLQYIRKSAEPTDNPCSVAQWVLGLMYEEGRCGLEKNSVLAKEWKDKAVANGHIPS